MTKIKKSCVSTLILLSAITLTSATARAGVHQHAPNLAAEHWEMHLTRGIAHHAQRAAAVHAWDETAVAADHDHSLTLHKDHA